VLRLATSVNAPAHSSRRRARVAAGVLGLATVVILALVVDLGRADFWDPGESRYVETVREMMISGNWLDPTLGFLRYYDKPPGYFWLVGGAFAVFGRTEWAARAPSVAAAALTIVLVVAFAWRRLGPRAALTAGAILATAVHFVALGRSVRMDMVLTLLVTATLLQAFALWERPAPGTADGPRATWPLYALPAAGLLVKGPVAVLLPALIVIAYLIATRTTFHRDRIRPDTASLVALGIIAAWYSSQAVRAPDYLWTFLWQHNFGRFLGRTLAGHPEPIWFYLWILPLTFLPWTLFLPGALYHGQHRARRGHHLSIFLLLWCAIPFVFFSVCRAKLATYLLPIFPALALLVAAYLDRVVRAPASARARAFRVPALTWTIGMAAIAFGIPVAATVAYPAFVRDALAALLLAIFPVLGWHVVRRARWQAVPVVIGVAALATQVAFYRLGTPVVNEFSSLRAAAEIGRAHPPAAKVVA
jgi:4-amino-4-deoxy-L-arabinose transferase